MTVTTEGRLSECLISCFLQISFTPGSIFIELWPNVHRSKMISITHDSICLLKVLIEVHEFELLILCQLHISCTPETIFHKILVKLFAQCDDEQNPLDLVGCEI